MDEQTGLFYSALLFRSTRVSLAPVSTGNKVMALGWGRGCVRRFCSQNGAWQGRKSCSRDVNHCNNSTDRVQTPPASWSTFSKAERLSLYQ